jgi:hypothetical protein
MVLKEPKEFMQTMSMSKRHRLLNFYVYSHGGRTMTPGEQLAERAHFDLIKHTLMPLNNVTCYTCTAPALHRHHVIPICRGGASTLRNLVGLCIPCHRRYDYIAHKEKRTQRETTYARATRNRKVQSMNRVGSLSQCSEIVYMPKA